MATLHKLWESLPFGYLVPGLTAGFATSKQTRTDPGDLKLKKIDTVI